MSFKNHLPLVLLLHDHNFVFSVVGYFAASLASTSSCENQKHLYILLDAPLPGPQKGRGDMAFSCKSVNYPIQMFPKN